jgi:hypothetical protein
VKAPAKKGTSERTAKKAEVIAMMKRAKGVTRAEIVAATGWQKHTIRGFVKHPRKQGRREDRVERRTPQGSAPIGSRSSRRKFPPTPRPAYPIDMRTI